MMVVPLATAGAFCPTCWAAAVSRARKSKSIARKGAKAAKLAKLKKRSFPLRLGAFASWREDVCLFQRSRRISQNLNRRLVCKLRMALAPAGNPNCGLVMVVYQLVKVA